MFETHYERVKHQMICVCGCDGLKPKFTRMVVFFYERHFCLKMLLSVSCYLWPQIKRCRKHKHSVQPCTHFTTVVCETSSKMSLGVFKRHVVAKFQMSLFLV